MSIHPELPSDWDSVDACEAIRDLLLTAVGNEEQVAIALKGVEVISLLLQKNAEYGSSALNPIRVFARGMSPLDLIYVRMDDKLSRVANGTTREDALFDLVGYGILALVARERA